MRKLFTFLPPSKNNGLTAASSPPTTTSFVNLSKISSLSSPSPAPAGSPIDDYRQPLSHYLSPSVPFTDTALDLTTLSIILGLILLSLLSTYFIFHLRLRSRQLNHLQNFNSFWTFRLLLVTFAALWALNEVVRLPYLNLFLPPLTLNQQSNICKVHVVLSFGFLQPGFLITLLFLMNISIQKKQNPGCKWGLALVCLFCVVILLLQILFVFRSPLEEKLPKYMHTSSMLGMDAYGNKTVVCTYPLLSCITFAVFAIGYSVAFLVCCWRVAAFVINKSIRMRINVLILTVMVSLPVQILCLGISPVWLPQEAGHRMVGLAMFVAVACCVAVAQMILVVRPIADALATAAAGSGGVVDCCSQNEIRLGQRPTRTTIFSLCT